MGSLPLLLYHYFSKLAADTNAVNKANLPNVEVRSTKGGAGIGIRDEMGRGGTRRG